MKKGLKVLAFVLAFVAAMTFAQAPTFAEIIAVDKEFFSSFIGSPSKFIGMVVFWKYVILLLGMLSAVIVGVVSVLCKKKPAIKKSNKKKAKAVAPQKVVASTSKARPIQPVKTSKGIQDSAKVATPVSHNQVQNTGSSSRFIRVNSNKK